MNLSLNEVEALSRKAARGAGMSWGLAEEAGKAARWLAAQDLPGPRLLAQLLLQNDRAEYDALCPDGDAAIWAASAGLLCPLIAGAALSDHAAHLAEGRDIAMGRTSYPLFLLPFAAGAAAQLDRPVQITWPGTAFLATPQGIHQLTALETLETPATDGVTISAVESIEGAKLRQANRAKIDAATLADLNAFAHRTYAPETPESRLAGAGAGLTDND